MVIGGSMKEKLVVGNTVFLKPLYNKARYSSDIEKGVITKIGRKYFEVSTYDDMSFPIKFIIETMLQQTDYSPNWKVYLSEQEILDEKESQNLIMSITKYVGLHGEKSLSLDQLRRIYNIINE